MHIASCRHFIIFLFVNMHGLFPQAEVSAQATVEYINNAYSFHASIAVHPWLRSESHPIPLDILIYKLVKSYLNATPLKRAALKVSSIHIFFCLLFKCISLIVP